MDGKDKVHAFFNHPSEMFVILFQWLFGVIQLNFKKNVRLVPNVFAKNIGVSHISGESLAMDLLGFNPCRTLIPGACGPEAFLDRHQETTQRGKMGHGCSSCGSDGVRLLRPVRVRQLHSCFIHVFFVFPKIRCQNLKHPSKM